jgi:class 3 adenylate cyclase/tetratricopeptide (TPR) repeat protein
MASCPQCRHANPPTAKFCNHCGARQEACCARCGHANAPGSRFCGECGAALAGSGAAPTAYTPEHLAARILTSRSALEGERKQVTVLLADLKGSMELLADRDPEEARRLLDPVLERMMAAVHHYEGTVNQVMGDGIMALFGAPLAHEDHALRACYAALRMQDSVGRYGDEVQRTQGVPVQIRVGLNSGEVVVRSIGSDLHMDYTAVGQTTHLAARMEQMAKPGSILVTSATHRLVEGHVHVRSLGPVPVRGLSEPLEVFELQGAATSLSRLRVAAARGLTRFTGRDAELDQLRAAQARAGGGHGQVVALVGEAGAGKSRLVWELAHGHRSGGWLVLESTALSYGQATAFLPVVDLLRGYFAIEARDDGRRVREKLTGRVLTLDEGLRPALPALQALLDVPVEDPAWARQGADRQRARIRDAVRLLLLRESEVQPLLLVFEDLHWIDPETQALLDALVESLPSHRVLLVVNYRPEYRHAWGGQSYYGQLRLDPLPPETVDTLLDVVLGDDAGLAPLRRLLIERAQGNPFFLEEIVRALVEGGVLGGERGRHHLARALPIAEVPATVQSILAARIDRLPPEDKAVLQSASVIGNDLALAVLQAIAGLSEEALAGVLARLQAGEFLYETRLFPDVEYTFKHALTHEVAYGSLLGDRRRALHAQVVAAMERLHGDRIAEHRHRMVHHAFRGELWDRALVYLKDLNEVATEADIVEVMGSGNESPGRLWWAGEHERARRAAERDLAVAGSFANFGLRVVAGCRLGQAHHALGDHARAAEVLRETAVSLTGDLVSERFGMAGCPAVFARSYLAWALAEQGHFAEAAAVSEESRQLAEAAGDVYNEAQCAFGIGHCHVVQGRPDRAIPVLERALVAARLAGLPFVFPFLMTPLGAAYALAGQPDRAAPLLEQAIDQGASMKLRAHHALRLVWLARTRMARGQLDQALEHARQALGLARECGERGNEAYAHLALGDIAARSDKPDVPAAEAAYGQAHALAEALAMRPLVARCHLGRGGLHRRGGASDRARRELDTAVAMFEAMGMAGWLTRAEAERLRAATPP